MSSILHLLGKCYNEYPLLLTNAINVAILDSQGMKSTACLRQLLLHVVLCLPLTHHEFSHTFSGEVLKTMK